jgi:hypothetical protein
LWMIVEYFKRDSELIVVSNAIAFWKNSNYPRNRSYITIKM